MAKPRIFTTGFDTVYPLYIQKAEKKSRTKEEVDEIICRLTGYDTDALEEQIRNHVDIETFFNEAPSMHPDSSKIKGKICGVQIEDIKDPLMQKIRYLDKLIDDLAKGKSMDRILCREEPRSSKVYEYDSVIHCTFENGGAYIIFPWNVRTEFGRGRVKVSASFDGEPYEGSIVNMGLKNDDGSVCYIIGIPKAIRNKIRKGDHDSVHVVIRERE